MAGLRRFGAAVVLLGLASAAVAKQPTKRPPEEKRGEILYERHCIQCHGDAVGGDGPATSSLVFEVPSLRGQLDRKDIEKYMDVVLKGKGPMPGYSASLDEDQARTVLRHMARRSNKKVDGTMPPEEEPETEEEESNEEAGE